LPIDPALGAACIEEMSTAACVDIVNACNDAMQTATGNCTNAGPEAAVLRGELTGAEEEHFGYRADLFCVTIPSQVSLDVVIEPCAHSGVPALADPIAFITVGEVGIVEFNDDVRDDTTAAGIHFFNYYTNNITLTLAVSSLDTSIDHGGYVVRLGFDEVIPAASGCL